MSSPAARSPRATVAVLALLSLGAGCGATPPRAPPGPRADAEPRECTAALRLEDAPDTAGEEPRPRTAASLVLLCADGPPRAASLGVEVGACVPFDARPGVLLATHCWWGDVGAVLEVVLDGSRLVVRRAAVDGRGRLSAWEARASLEVPEGASVVPL